MIFGDPRMSMDSQSLAIQQGQLKAAVCEHVYSDSFTGTTADRPLFKRLMAKLREGDTVVIRPSTAWPVIRPISW